MLMIVFLEVSVKVMAELFIVCGVPGSGKSLLGKRLAMKVKGVFLDRDTLMGPLVDVALEASGLDSGDLDSSLGKALTKAGTVAVEDVALENLVNGVNVVVVLPYSNRVEAGWVDRFVSAGFVPKVVWLRLDDLDVVRERLEFRSSVRDGVTLANWDRFVSLVQLDSPVGEFVEVDALLDSDDAFEVAVRLLGL